MNVSKALNSIATAAGLAGAAWILAAAAGIPLAQAQDDRGRQGLPQDWTHRHILFSEAGAAVDAFVAGSMDTHGKIKSEPRYILQQRRLKAGENPDKEKKGKNAGSTDAEAAAEATIAAAGGKKGKNPPAPPPPEPPAPPEPPESLKPDGDWSYSMGGNGATVAPGMYPAKYTWDINATPSCTGDFAVFAANQTGRGASVAASQTGTFSTNVRSTGSITITNGSNTLTMTPNPTSAYVQGTFSGNFGSGNTITITVPGNTLTLTAGASNACANSTQGTFKAENSTTNQASSLKSVIEACYSSFSQVGVRATNSGSTVTVSTATPGADITLTVSDNSDKFSWGAVTPGTDGTNTCSSSTSGTFAISNTMATQASNLAAALNLCPVAAGVTASSAGAVVTVTARSPGSAGNSISLGETLTGFAWDGGTLAGGVDAQPSILALNNLYSGPAVAASGTGTFTANTVEGGQSVTVGGVSITASPPTAATGSFTVAVTADNDKVTIAGIEYKFKASIAAPRDDKKCEIKRDSNNDNTVNAARLAAAINNGFGGGSDWVCYSGDSPNASVSASTNAAQVTLTARNPGTSGNSITWTNGTTGKFSPTSGTLSGGSDGSNTGTNFAYWSGSSRTTTAALATNLAAAIERNKASTGAGASASGSVVTVTATATGPSGKSIALGGSLNDFAWSDTTLHGGTNQGICGTGGPTLHWAYDTHTGAGGPVTTSPVLSWDGSKIAYVENRSAADGGAVLHVLRWKGGQGTLSSPAVPDQVITSGSCPAGDSSCLFSLNYTTAANTNSSPFYDYASDVIYVGDDNGTLWKITGVFNGTPAKAGGAWASGILVNAGQKLTGPVFDPVSRNVFVADESGTVHFVREVGSTAGACASGSPPCKGSTTMSAGSGLKDPPVVDPSTRRVFAFGGNGVVQGNTALGDVRAASVGTVERLGAFDRNYLTSSNPVNGKLYVCGTSGSQPALYRLGFSSGGTLNSAYENGPLALTTSGGGACSPLSAIYNPNQGIEWLFAGVPSNCAFNGSAGGCIMAFNITGGFPERAVATGAEAGGTSGIVVDNVSEDGQASSLYYSTQSNAACDVGGSSAGCAVKRTQSGLK